MEFTFVFLAEFIEGLVFVGPILISLGVFITLLGHVVGRLESWNNFDAVYWAFITATTVGYGDIRPMGRLAKILSIIIALLGMIFTGLMVALAVNAVTDSYYILRQNTNT